MYGIHMLVPLKFEFDFVSVCGDITVYYIMLINAYELVLKITSELNHTNFKWYFTCSLVGGLLNLEVQGHYVPYNDVIVY